MVDVDAYVEDGYVVITIGPDLAADLRRAAEQLVPGANVDAVLLPHHRSDGLRDALHHSEVTSAVRTIVQAHLPVAWRSADLKLVASELLVRPPRTKGVPWHQDEAHWSTRDRSLTGTWIPLEMADRSNGTLQFVRGSHRPGTLYECRPSDPDPCYRSSMSCEAVDGDVVTVEVDHGSAVLFNGYTVHRSLPNVSDRRRLVLSAHYCSAATNTMSWLGSGHTADECPRADNRNVDLLYENGTVSSAQVPPLGSRAMLRRTSLLEVNGDAC